MKNLAKILLNIVLGLIKPLLAVILGFLILQACTGCKTKTITAITKINEKTERTDSSSSIRERIVIKDSIVYKPKVEIRYQVVNPCDSNGKLKPINQTGKSGSGKSSLRSKGDTLFVDCDCDEQIQRFKSEISTKDSTIRSLKTHALMTSETKTIEVEKYKTPFWNWVLIIFLSSLSGYLIIKKILS